MAVDGPVKTVAPQTPSKLDPHSVEYAVRSGIAGGVAGCAAKTLMAPLDRVKILFQTGEPEFRRWAGTILGLPRAAKYIWQREGPLGLFRGHSATLARIFPYAAIKFVAYEQIRATLIPSKAYETHGRRFAAGSLAGLASVICTYPLDVVRVQLAYTGSRPEVRHDKHRLLNTIREMWNRPAAVPPAAAGPGGVPGGVPAGPTVVASRFATRLANFYPGFGPTLIGVIPYAGVSFFAHDLGHDIFRSRLLSPIAVNHKLKKKAGRTPLKGWAELLAGGLSGIVAQTSAYPLEVIRRRMQVSGIRGNVPLTMRQTVKSIYSELGIRGFFIGLSIGYIKVGPMFACSFYVYEQMKYLLGI